VYDRADFSSPIERARVSAEVVKLPEGEIGRAFTGEIQLARIPSDPHSLRPQGPLEKFASTMQLLGTNNSPFVPYDKKDKDLTVEPTAFFNVFQVTHARGAKTLVWVDHEKNKVTVTNNLKLQGKNESNTRYAGVEVIPQPLGTVEDEDSVAGYFKAFMRTMDFTAGLLEFGPENNKLKRIYPVGKEKKPFVHPSQVAPNVGRVATTTPSKPPSRAENSKESREDIESLDCMLWIPKLLWMKLADCEK
jgi:hypothetical protein